jgi:hypothetical protein
MACSRINTRHHQHGIIEALLEQQRKVFDEVQFQFLLNKKSASPAKSFPCSFLSHPIVEQQLSSPISPFFFLT